MSACCYRLTPELRLSRAGTTAEPIRLLPPRACGIPEAISSPMDGPRHEQRNARPPYREFAAEIQAAVAHARCMAEIKMQGESGGAGLERVR